jgi:hypothetical protein
MASNKFFQNAVVAAATLSVAVLAGCPGTPTTVTPSGTPSTKPSTPASGAPASGTPASPASPASGASAATPSAAPTAIPSTPDTSSRATIQGIVFDDQDQRLSDVTVTGKILGAGTFANGSDTLSVSTQVGSYALNGAPTGQTILITAGKNGLTTRQQTIVPLANLQGNTDQNRVDFGSRTATNANETFAMSDKPEVTTMTPKPDATGVDPTTTFTLNWSEPVNTSDVENYFAVAVSSGSAASTYPMSSQGVTIGKVNKMFNPSADEFEYTGTAVTANARITTAIFDTSHFTFAWSNSNQTVTATFRAGYKLPTDKDSSKIPQYAVGFKNAVRDAAGTGRDKRFFRVSPAQLGKNGYKFTVASDTTAPKLIGITALNNSVTNGGKDVIRFQFSETMVLYPTAGAMTTSVRIPDTDKTGDALVKTSYYGRQQPNRLVADGGGVTTDTPTGVTQLFNFGVDQSAVTILTFGSQNVKTTAHTPQDDTGLDWTGATTALFDGDPSQSTILLNSNQTTMFDTDAASAGGTGKKIWGGVKSIVEDPAGNAIDTSNNNNIKSSNSI